MTRDAATMIRFHAVNGMSRAQLERIYGRDAVLRVLGAVVPAVPVKPIHLERFGRELTMFCRLAWRDELRARKKRRAA